MKSIVTLGATLIATSVNELIDSEKVAAIVGPANSGNALA